jgi:hypothetical protein
MGRVAFGQGGVTFGAVFDVLGDPLDLAGRQRADGEPA